MAPRILVVEDDPLILRIVALRLQGQGYEVLTAADGEAALDMVRDEKPDMAILDLDLPTLRGEEVCEQVKTHDESKDMPIILFTASEADVVAEKVAELRADDFIAKPFRPEELLEKVSINLTGKK
jgi:DNA-binding response OmpR family regulator